MNTLYINRAFSDGCLEAEKEFLAWWNEEHLSAMLNISGVEEGRLYVSVKDTTIPKYLILFVLNSSESTATEEWRANIEDSEWLTRLNMHFSWSSGTYEKLFSEPREGKDAFLKGDYLYITRHTPMPQMEDVYKLFYDNEHLKEICNLPGFLSGRLYQRIGTGYHHAPKYAALYDIDDPLVDERPAWIARRKANQKSLVGESKKLRAFPGAYRRL